MERGVCVTEHEIIKVNVRLNNLKRLLSFFFWKEMTYQTWWNYEKVVKKNGSSYSDAGLNVTLTSSCVSRPPKCQKRIQNRRKKWSVARTHLWRSRRKRTQRWKSVWNWSKEWMRRERGDVVRNDWIDSQVMQTKWNRIKSHQKEGTAINWVGRMLEADMFMQSWFDDHQHFFWCRFWMMKKNPAAAPSVGVLLKAGWKGGVRSNQGQLFSYGVMSTIWAWTDLSTIFKVKQTTNGWQRLEHAWNEMGGEGRVGPEK